MQYIIINKNGETLATYSSWNKKALEIEITKVMNDYKDQEPKAYKCKLTHQIINDKLWKLKKQ